jgi:hypothetical protein
MELDKALQYAVVLAWDDLTKVFNPCSIRVEYQCPPGTPLDHVSVWSARARGYQDRVCDYWMAGSLTHPHGVQFTNGYVSDKLVEMLDLVMKNQGQFTRAADACRDGLVLIYPPSGGDQAAAATWMSDAHGAPMTFGGAVDPIAPHSMPLVAARALGIEALDCGLA